MAMIVPLPHYLVPLPHFEVGKRNVYREFLGIDSWMQAVASFTHMIFKPGFQYIK